jgi:drug/metabolite transporter (DMT)-like permease
VSVVLALLSSVLWGTSDFLGGLHSRRRPSYAVVAGSQACGLVAIATVAILTSAWQGPLGWLPWAVGSGLAGSAGLVCFYAALAGGTMGVVSPIAALGAVVPLAVGVLAGESPSALAVSGIALALAGAVAASGPELRGGAGARPVLLAALAGVGFGVALTLIARGSRVDAVMTLAGMRLTSVLAFGVAALALRTLGGLTVEDVGPLAAIGVGDVAANLLFALATQRGLLSVTSVLGSLYPVVTVLLARTVVHERLRPVQQVGVTGALVGVVLVSMA